MKKLLPLILAIAGLLGVNAPTAVAATTPVCTGNLASDSGVLLESQGWWRKAGISVPSAVGQHIHLQACVPKDGAIVNGLYNIPVTVTLHAMPAKTSYIRVFQTDSGSNTEKYHASLVMGPCLDTCTQNLTVPLDFSTWHTGRVEMRWTVNIPDADPNTSGSQRQYQSTGWEVCPRSCSPSYRSGNFIEARGWYQDHDYANARLTSALTTVRSGGTISVKLAPGSGGDPTKFSGVYVDPKFHDGIAGIVCKTVNGPYTGSVTLPTLSSGQHKLVLLSSDGQNAGVQAITFNVP